MNESGILINCMSLEDQLAKLEVLGSKSFQLLQKLLHPVTCFPNTWQLNKCSIAEADTKTHLCKSSILEIEDYLSSHASPWASACHLSSSRSTKYLLSCT